MALNHRRMILEFPDLNLQKICSPLCTPDYKGCSSPCIDICQSFCDHSYPPPNPPPPPSIPSTIYSSLYPPTKPHKLSPALSIFLAIFATTFFIFCCYTIYKYYKYRCSSRRRSISPSQPQTDETHDDFLDEDHGPVVDHPIWYIRTIGLQQSIIDSITVCKYKKSDGLVEGTECSVCLSEFQEDDTLRLLPKCNHAFHIPCIDTWLRSHTNCPMCRAGIISVATAAASPLPEPSTVENSGVGEEILEGSSENNSGFGRDGEELEIMIDQEGELRAENGLNNEIFKEREDIQPMRRSVSFDSLSASMISLAIANDLQAQSEGNSNTQLVKMNESNVGIAPKRLDVNQSLLRLVGSSTIGRSLQKGPISMKRSVSCSGKVLLSRHSRSRNSVLPQ